MRLPRFLIVLALAPASIEAQATSVEEPQPHTFVEEYTKLLGIHDAIGDLRKLSIADSALELRFYSIGGSVSALRLQRSATGVWTTQRIVIEGPRRAARIEALPPIANTTLDSLWDQLVSEGVLTLAIHVPRKWRRLDGLAYLLELRRGQSYRASYLYDVEKPEVPADVSIRRIAAMLKRHFPFIFTPAK